MLDILNDKALIGDWLAFGTMFIVVRLLEGGDLQDENWIKGCLFTLLGLGAYHLAVKNVAPKIGNGEIKAVIDTWVKVGTVNVVARLLSGEPLDEKWFVGLAYTILGFNAYTLVVSKVLPLKEIKDKTMRTAANTAGNVGTMLLVSRVLSGGALDDKAWAMSSVYTIAGFVAYDLVVSKIVN